jgi:hypothetical protein
LGLTKQKSRSTLASNRKSNRLASSAQPQIQKRVNAGEAFNRYVDKKSIARGKQTVKIIKMSATNQNAFAISSRRLLGVCLAGR